MVRLGSAVVAGLTVHTEVLGEQAARHFTAAADLAEELAQRFRLDYRTAYRVVGRAVAATLDSGGAELTLPVVHAAVEEITGTTLPVTPDLLTAATEPVSAVAARDVPGGASPRRVREHARRVRRRVAAARQWNAARRTRITRAEADLIAAAEEIAAGLRGEVPAMIDTPSPDDVRAGEHANRDRGRR